MGPGLRRDDGWRFLFGLLALLLAWSSTPSPAAAHPHVWITAKSQVLYAPDGSVAGVRKIKTPARLAQLVMQETDHIMMVGQGADQLARARVDEPHRRRVAPVQILQNEQQRTFRTLSAQDIDKRPVELVGPVRPAATPG